MTGVCTVARVLETAAISYGQRTALLGLDHAPLTHQDLGGLVGSVAERLSDHGVGPESRVALVIENGPAAATAFLSIACAAACAPLNPSYRRDELDFFLGDLGARAVVVSDSLDSPVRDAARARGVAVLELHDRPGLRSGCFDLDGPLPSRAELPVRSPDDEALLLHTSGTTARPKLVPLTQKNLAVSSGNVARTLALRPEDRCLNVMPLFHIHGLVAALLASLRTGGSVVCTPGFHPVRVFDWIRDFGPTWFTAVPTMYQGLLIRGADHMDVIRRHRLRFLRSSSASLPVAVLDQVERLFGVPVIEAYGMTEAAHQVASNPLPPGDRHPGQVGPAAGPEVAILSPAGTHLPPGSIGEVAIRGANVFSGYDGNPEANAAAFTDGWFRTGDEGTVDADGSVTLHGRIKELINRGGEKIAPIEVDERLLAHPSVAEAVTFAIPDPRLGEEVGAAVVAAAGHRADERTLQDHVAQTLAPFKVPRRIVVVDEIPKGPTGKVQRLGLAETLGMADGPAAPAVHEEPRTDFERWIARIWGDVLDLPSVGRHDDFFSLGGDSILGGEAVARLREVTGRPDLPLVSIVRAPTVASMARELDGATSALARSGPILLSESSSDRRLFFVHGGDGEILGFASLARLLAPDYALFGVRARGIDDDEEPDESIDQMASGYVDRVRDIQPQGPYAVGGFCLGALVAIEMAVRLDEAGEEVSIVLVDPRLPQPRDGRYRVWRLSRRLQPASLVSALRTVAGRRRAQQSGHDGSAIEERIARLREAHRPRRSLAPGVSILGEQHLQYRIPPWVVARSAPNARSVRIPVPHTAMLQPPGVEVLAREIRIGLGEAI